MHLSHPQTCTTRKVNSIANYGLQLMIMYQQWFINCNRRTTLKQNFNNRRNLEQGRYRQQVLRTLHFLFNFSVNQILLIKNVIYAQVNIGTFNIKSYKMEIYFSQIAILLPIVEMLFCFLAEYYCLLTSLSTCACSYVHLYMQISIPLLFI